MNPSLRSTYSFSFFSATLRGDNRVETLYLGAAGMVLAVLLLEKLEPLYRHTRHLAEVLVDTGNLVLDTRDELFVLVLVELCDALHLDFQQSQDVLLAHLANHRGVERSETLVDICAELVGISGVLEAVCLYIFAPQ